MEHLLPLRGQSMKNNAVDHPTCLVPALPGLKHLKLLCGDSLNFLLSPPCLISHPLSAVVGVTRLKLWTKEPPLSLSLALPVSTFGSPSELPPCIDLEGPSWLALPPPVPEWCRERCVLREEQDLGGKVCVKTSGEPSKPRSTISRNMSGVMETGSLQENSTGQFADRERPAMVAGDASMISSALVRRNGPRGSGHRRPVLFAMLGAFGAPGGE
mmetsp:Transcript_16784/g.47937  ORF Transcript_16784/g.47937 Transcript_16784/m.47937 type:complete len:214 (-) Transcript_16784:838-1479(-)